MILQCLHFVNASYIYAYTSSQMHIFLHKNDTSQRKKVFIFANHLQHDVKTQCQEVQYVGLLPQC